MGGIKGIGLSGVMRVRFEGRRGGVAGFGESSLSDARTRRVGMRVVAIAVRGDGSTDGDAASKTVMRADAAAGPVYRAVCTLFGA